ncbi:MAG TPA: M13 family metallopeptidase [Terracidiphilus sp.]|nr:M13 family metallopeptidase [Terracidiphilus sp.]
MKSPRFAIFAACLLATIPVLRAQTGQDSNTPPERLPGLDLTSVDKSADPCVDFYQYACGKFDEHHPIPADHSSYATFNILMDWNESILRGMLEKTSAGGSNRTPNEQKIGDYYASCMDTAAIEREGLKPLQLDLDRIAALKSKEELVSLLAYFQLTNVNAFLAIGEMQDFKDATRQIAVIDQSGLGLPERDYYLRTGPEDEKIRKQYVQHVTNIFKLLGEPEAKAAGDAQKVMDLETELAKASLDVTSRRDPAAIYHMLSLDDLQKRSPAIDWKQLMNEVGAPPVAELNVTYPPFFEKLNTLLQSTDLETIKTYLRWQLINAMPGTALPEALDQEQFNFFGTTLRGQPKQEPRWKRCARATDGALGEALGQVYVEQEFPPSSKAATLAMVHEIEAAMDADLDTLDWMSPETKAKAKQKLQALANKIGYPDKWRDYSKLQVARGDALGNALRAVEFENHRQLDKIGQPVDRGEFFMSPPTVNAYYDPSMNDINFPAGILQPPFYDTSAPDAVNYGHIGAVVGHELTHGFDDQGRKFDSNGNLTDWWTATDAQKFDEKADCEVKEYSSFSVPGDVKVNGKLTLGENTADNGGLRLAYIAFLADANNKKIDLNKTTDGYTALQQFFLGFAQNWCGNVRPETERMQVQTNEHSPIHFRVTGVVQNMPEFGKAFGCKTGQPMMPANACRVW